MANSNFENNGEEHFSQVLARLDRIDRSLKEIEANTRSLEEKKYVFRGLEKVWLLSTLF